MGKRKTRRSFKKRNFKKRKTKRKTRSVKKSVRKLSVRMKKYMRKKTKGKKKRRRTRGRRRRGGAEWEVKYDEDGVVKNAHEVFDPVHISEANCEKLYNRKILGPNRGVIDFNGDIYRKCLTDAVNKKREEE